MSVSVTYSKYIKMEGKHLTKRLSEENDELKRYIETLNKECMELQAALFEEANKMTQTAYAAEYAAKKRADECSKENEVLKKEVQALKNILRLHMEENSDVFAVHKSVSNVVTPEIEEKTGRSSFRRLNFPRNSVSSTLPPSANGSLHGGDRSRYSSTISNSSNTAFIINVASQEPVTRRRLLDAFTSSVVCAETVAEEQFQEFVDWVEGGCCVTWPEDFSAIADLHSCSLANIIHNSHEYDESTGESHGDQPAYRNDSDVDEILLLHKQYPDLNSVPTLPPAPQPPPKQLAFFHRLVKEDIAPALEFADRRICKALRVALGYLGVEIEPLTSLSICDPNGLVAKETPKCPLVPCEPVRFRIKLETTKEDGSLLVESFQICSWARQRIAAVADLFQYISLIRRGLTGTLTTPANRSLSNSLQSNDCNSVDSGNDSDPLMEPTRRHQFENIQRRRLNIALSRLGYGLPSAE
nr:glucosamine fructose 6 phosphate [Hymenolepis microstoma]